MTTNPPGERAVIEEALEILLRHMEPAKVATFFATWQTDGQDYLATRDRLFGSQTVDDLYEQVRAFRNR